MKSLEERQKDRAARREAGEAERNASDIARASLQERALDEVKRKDDEAGVTSAEPSVKTAAKKAGKAASPFDAPVKTAAKKK